MKNFSWAVIFLLVCGLASAQTTISYKAGINSTYFSVPAGLDYSAEVHVQAGAFLDIPLNSYLDLNAGLTYAHRTGDFTGIWSFGGFLGNFVYYDYALNYLEIPVLLELKAPVIEESLTASMLLGPQLNILLYGEETLTDEYKQVSSRNTLDNMQTIIPALNVGLRLSADAGTGAIFLDLNYVYDLDKSLDERSFGVYVPLEMRTFTLMAGYSAPI